MGLFVTGCLPKRKPRTQRSHCLVSVRLAGQSRRAINCSWLELELYVDSNWISQRVPVDHTCTGSLPSSCDRSHLRTQKQLCGLLRSPHLRHKHSALRSHPRYATQHTLRCRACVVAPRTGRCRYRRSAASLQRRAAAPAPK